MADSSLRLFLGVKNHTYPNGATMHDVAIWNEFGTETIPPRPAFRMGMERSIKKNNKLIKAQIGNLARAGLMKNSKMGKELTEQRTKVLLTQLGRSAVKEVKDIIKNSETVANAPRTVAKKGFDHPLFETGELLKGVEYLVGE